MFDYYNNAVEWLKDYPIVFMSVCLAILVIIALLANIIIKKILIRGVIRIINSTLLKSNQQPNEYKFINRLANIVPATIISLGINLIPGVSPVIITIVHNVCSAFIIFSIALALGHLLDLVNLLWQKRKDAANKPIKGYIQIVKIVVYAIATILIIAALIDKSPVILLSGLGAMAAVLMLVFQDTLLSLVASVQITSNDIIRMGDWVEMPQQNVDGEVIDIALHTVKVQNWDNTINTIPTKKFIAESFKNWRGMQESGGRRIKRSLFIDQKSVHFLTNEEIEHLKQFKLLKSYLEDKNKEIDEWNEKYSDSQALNSRRITNLGTFRAYVVNYLHQHPNISQNMTLMVRQLAPTSEGLPLELYCFTNDIRWVNYEGIQSDIFDHLFAILPEFGLHIFQIPGGTDIANITLLPKQ